MELVSDSQFTVLSTLSPSDTLYLSLSLLFAQYLSVPSHQSWLMGKSERAHMPQGDTGQQPKCTVEPGRPDMSLAFMRMGSIAPTRPSDPVQTPGRQLCLGIWCSLFGIRHSFELKAHGSTRFPMSRPSSITSCKPPVDCCPARVWPMQNGNGMEGSDGRKYTPNKKHTHTNENAKLD